MTTKWSLRFFGSFFLSLGPNYLELTMTLLCTKVSWGHSFLCVDMSPTCYTLRSICFYYLKKNYALLFLALKKTFTYSKVKSTLQGAFRNTTLFSPSPNNNHFRWSWVCTPILFLCKYKQIWMCTCTLYFSCDTKVIVLYTLLCIMLFHRLYTLEIPHHSCCRGGGGWDCGGAFGGEMPRVKKAHGADRRRNQRL